MRLALILSAAMTFVMSCKDSSPTTTTNTPDASIDEEPDASPLCLNGDCQCVSDNDCGEHATCITGDASSLCACVDGYGDVNGKCAWLGLVNPDFDEGVTGWTLVGDTVAIDAAAPGSDRAGEAIFSYQAVNNVEKIRQTIKVGPRDKVDKMVLTVTHRIAGNPWLLALGTAVSVNGRYYNFPGTLGDIAWHSKRFCLGDIIYDGNLTIEVSAAEQNYGANQDSLHIDRVNIEPAAPGECPAQNGILDGDFSAQRWTTGVQDANFDESSIESGAQGNYLRLAADDCGTSFATTVASIPTRSPGDDGVALEVRWNGTAGDHLEVALQRREWGGLWDLLTIGSGGRAIGTLTSTDSNATSISKICVPDWALSMDYELRMSLVKTLNRNGQQCLGSPGVRAFEVYEVSLVDEPSCSPGAGISDPSFELSGNALLEPGWLLYASEFVNASVINNVDEAYAGNRALRLQALQGATAQCEASVARTFVDYNLNLGADESPAISYRYRFSPTASATAYIETTGEVQDGYQRLCNDGSGNYQQATMCFRQQVADRPIGLFFGFFGQECTTIAEQSAYIDDIAITKVKTADCTTSSYLTARVACP